MQPAPTKRVGYRKSRNGCLRCKRRRVKCDERVPCTACVRHQTQCSLETSTVEQQTNATKAKGRSPSNSHNSWSHISSPGGNSANPPLLLFGDETDETDCWISNAELTFHYTNVSSRSLHSFSEDVTATFQVIIPREGLSHPYLLRAIMAFSAYHIAHLTPEKRPYYSLLAGKHQVRAVRGMSEALAGTITSENCHGMYCSFIFLAINKFAAFPSCTHRSDGCCSPLQSLAEIFYMIHGTSAILRSSEENIRNGPLKAIFNLARGTLAPEEEMRIFCQKLHDLQLHIDSSSLDSDTKLSLSGAVQSLGACFPDAQSRAIKISPDEIRILFAWAGLVPRGFLDLVKSSHPVALVVLAYYSCLMHWSSEKYWFLQGWTESLKQCIVRKLDGSPWEEMARWPISIIGDRGE